MNKQQQDQLDALQNELNMFPLMIDILKKCITTDASQSYTQELTRLAAKMKQQSDSAQQMIEKMNGTNLTEQQQTDLHKELQQELQHKSEQLEKYRKLFNTTSQQQ